MLGNKTLILFKTIDLLSGPTEKGRNRRNSFNPATAAG